MISAISVTTEAAQALTPKLRGPSRDPGPCQGALGQIQVHQVHQVLQDGQVVRKYLGVLVHVAALE